MQSLPPFAITTARKYLSDFDGDKLVNNLLPPQLGEYPELHAHEYFLSFVHGIVEKDRDVPVLYPLYIVDKDQPNVTVELTQESRHKIISNLQDPVEQRFLGFSVPAVTYVFRDKALYQIFVDCAKHSGGNRAGRGHLDQTPAYLPASGRGVPSCRGQYDLPAVTFLTA